MLDKIKGVKFKCPICKFDIKILEDKMVCESNHSFETKHGVYQLLEPSFKKKITEYLTTFEDFREKTDQKISEEHYDSLPYVNFNKELWNLRIMDYEMISALIKGRKNLNIIDLGAWNGWLSNLLSKDGNNVIAIDYFIDKYDGLGAQQFYKSKWLSVQMDLENLDSLSNNSFDVIIINRGMPYFTNLDTTLTNIKKKLKTNGILIITGITYSFKNKIVKSTLKKANNHFIEKYNSPLGFKKFKGYTDYETLNILRKHSFLIKSYKKLLFRNLIIKLFKFEKNQFYYGFYVKN